MELQALLVLCGVGVAGIAVVLLMGLFSTSGTSYEEAIAQQRRATTELLALADNKTKTKKTNKKANKKLAKKERNKDNTAAATASEPESEAPAESGVEDEPALATKPHVEFCPPVVVELPTDTPPNIKIRKRGKDPKVKPILLNKEDPSCVSDPSTLPSPAETTVSNHFEEMQPKDEFELLHSTFVGEKSVEKKEEIIEKKETKAAKTSKGGKSNAKPPAPEAVKDEGSRERHNNTEAPKEQKKAKKAEKKPQADELKKEKEKEEEEVVPPLNAPQPSELTTDKLLKLALAPVAAPVPAPSPPGGKNKKKKQEPNVLSLMAGEGGNVAVSELVRVVREATLSRTEIQILTDALLNKQHDQLPEHSEWTEGPNDPIQKLKKQLADKEKALADEIETHKGANNMLKELRATLAAERTKASAAAREAAAAAAALRAENNTLQKRLTRLADESTALAHENSLLQSKLEAEAQAHQVQLDMHMQRLSDSEAGLLAQLAALQAELSARVHEAGHARDAALLAQQHAAELAQQLQEANRAYSELEQQRQCAALADQQAQQAQQDLRLAQDRIAALTEEVQRLTTRAQTAEAALEKLKLATEEAEKQNQQLAGQVAALREEARARAAALAELPPALNGLPPAANDDKAAELAKVESVVESLRSELAAAQRSSGEQRDQLSMLQEQIDQYKEKNNELRTKNWKVMEALQSAERALQTKSASAMPAQDVSEAIAKAQESQFAEVANVLRSACPAASPASAAGRDWLQAFADNLKKELEKKEAEKKILEKEIEKIVQEKEKEKKEAEKKSQEQMEKKLREKELAEKELSSRVERLQQERESEKKRYEKELEMLENKASEPSQAPQSDERLLELVAQNDQLQATVDNYKRIVNDTEVALSQLQENVWREEQRWAAQLQAAQRELADLRTRTLLQMQNKIDALQAELQQKQSNYSNSFADAERLSQERLAEFSSKDVHNGPMQVGLEEK